MSSNRVTPPVVSVYMIPSTAAPPRAPSESGSPLKPSSVRHCYQCKKQIKGDDIPHARYVSNNRDLTICMQCRLKENKRKKATAAMEWDPTFAAQPTQLHQIPLDHDDHMIESNSIPSIISTRFFIETSYLTNGWVHLPRDLDSLQLAHDLVSAFAPLHVRDPLIQFDISGSVSQLDLTLLNEKSKTSTAATGKYSSILNRVRQLAKGVVSIVADVPEQHLEVLALKMLTSAPGEGEQMIHCDHLSGFDTVGRYTFLLYLTDHAPRTATWKFRRDQLPSSAENAPIPLDDDDAYARVWNKENYHRDQTVRMGDILLLDECLPHFGVTNTLSVPRRVIFVQVADVRITTQMLNIDNDSNDDSIANHLAGHDESEDGYQYYEWQHAEAAWGPDSKQFCQALINNKEENPLRWRFEKTEDKQAAVKAMREHGLFVDYFNSYTEPSWLKEKGKRIRKNSDVETYIASYIAYIGSYTALDRIVRNHTCREIEKSFNHIGY